MQHSIKRGKQLSIERCPVVLVISPFSEDLAYSLGILNECGYEARSVRTCCQGLAMLRKLTVPIVICDASLPDGSWRDLLRAAEMDRSSPALIVTSRLADDRLWAEVLNLGGYDLLAKPLQSQEVTRAVGSAWRDWTRRSPEETRFTKAIAAGVG